MRSHGLSLSPRGAGGLVEAPHMNPLQAWEAPSTSVPSQKETQRALPLHCSVAPALPPQCWATRAVVGVLVQGSHPGRSLPQGHLQTFLSATAWRGYFRGY